MTKIQDASLYEILPFNVKSENIEVQAFSYAVQQAISMLCKFSDSVRVMTIIDDMPESVIDNLAVELNLPCFHVESSLDVKRALVKDAFIWYNTAGTAYAIRRYFSTISQDTDIQEWFEYGGAPYHFRIIATVPEEQTIDTTLFNDIIIQIERLKNARSVLDEILVVKKYNEVDSSITIEAASYYEIEKSLGETEDVINLSDNTFILLDNDNVLMDGDFILTIKEE